MEVVVPTIPTVGSSSTERRNFGEWISSLLLLLTSELDLYQGNVFLLAAGTKTSAHFQSQLLKFLIKMTHHQQFWHRIPCVALA